jgi:outer membrane receptor protein involved in Fe transport
VDFGLATPARVSLDAYALVELTADAVLLEAGGNRPGLTALLRVENLFDASYEAALNFPGRGRTVLAGARLTY